MLRAALRLLLLTVALVSPAARLFAAPAPPLHDAHGIHVELVESLGARQLHARVNTAALGRAVDVRILLPVDYATETDASYPVLYLFHGTSGRASDWINAGDVQATTATLPVIVVMPDCGFNGDGGGWFADWFNGGALGTPMWETFHIEQLIPWIDANLRTVASASGRAVAGLSQGGFGSLSYAARHPDLFTSAAAFSGGCQIDRDAEAIDVATAIIQFTTSVLSGHDPNAIFGPRPTYNLNWQAHDPATLVTNLRGKDIHLWTGNGLQGPFDPGLPDTPIDPIEQITYNATRLFHGHLEDAGIAHGYTDYGNGTHSWPYWARDLREYVGPMMQRFANPPPPPRTISFLTADDQWERWGWQVALLRDLPAFSQLHHASQRGFALRGTGIASVRTPAFYAPGARVRIHMLGRGFTARSDVVVGASGRLRITVPLGEEGAPRATRVGIQVLTGPSVSPHALSRKESLSRRERVRVRG